MGGELGTSHPCEHPLGPPGRPPCFMGSVLACLGETRGGKTPPPPASRSRASAVDAELISSPAHPANSFRSSARVRLELAGARQGQRGPEEGQAASLLRPALALGAAVPRRPAASCTSPKFAFPLPEDFPQEAPVSPRGAGAVTVADPGLGVAVRPPSSRALITRLPGWLAGWTKPHGP